MTQEDSIRPALERLQARALLVGVIALALCVAWGFLRPAEFWSAYLYAYLFWSGIALGSLAVLMLHHMVGGAWGFVIRRPLEAATSTLPLMAALFVPLLFGLPHLYAWARPYDVAADPLMKQRSVVMNPLAFTIRAAVYFITWIVLARLLSRWSLEQDHASDPAELSRKMQYLSGPGTLLYVLFVSFAAIDWIMSLEPNWYSTVFGMLVICGQGIGTFAVMILLAALLVGKKRLEEIVLPSHIHDLGNLMLSFILLWTYMAYSQLIIIWSDNLADEIPHYLHRELGGWKWISLALILFQFALPFVLLLFAGNKKNIDRLWKIALFVLFMHLVDDFWLVAPSLYPHFHLSPADVLAPVGLGGLWLWDFARNLKGKPLVPVNDPRLQGLVRAQEAAEHA